MLHAHTVAQVPNTLKTVYSGDIVFNSVAAGCPVLKPYFEDIPIVILAHDERIEATFTCTWQRPCDVTRRPTLWEPVNLLSFHDYDPTTGAASFGPPACMQRPTLAEIMADDSDYDSDDSGSKRQKPLGAHDVVEPAAAPEDGSC